MMVANVRNKVLMKRAGEFLFQKFVKEMKTIGK
jgi:hypothetical protein